MATPNQLPAKSPIEDKYRSRLKITYRTNISGTPVPQTLPFRVLVLGELLGASARKAGLVPNLSDRKVRSIQIGDVNSGVEAFMKEMTPWMRVPEALRAKLESAVPGTVTFSNLTIPASPAYDPNTNEATVTVSGKATFTSKAADNGVCDIVDQPVGSISGQLTLTKGTPHPTPKGDVAFQLGGSFLAYIPDPSATLKGAPPLGPFTAVFAGVGQPNPQSGTLFATATLPQASFKVDDGGETTFALVPQDATKPLTAAATAARTLPFQDLRSFSPDGVAASIPELHRLGVLRDLVLELQSSLRNNHTLQKAVRETLKSGSQDGIVAFYEWAKQYYPLLVAG